MKRADRFFISNLPLIMAGAVFILAVSVIKFNLKAAPNCECWDLAGRDGEFVPGEERAYFQNLPVGRSSAELPAPATDLVLGLADPETKWIEIDLSEQKLVAWEGENVFLESLISSGKWGRTPVGEYQIWGKYKYTKMSGGNKEDNTYYYLPNVPYTMYFYKGFGLHGTYWHDNFGEPMSHGCVNLPTLVAEKLFYWTSPELPVDQKMVRADASQPGTRVIIHE